MTQLERHKVGNAMREWCSVHRVYLPVGVLRCLLCDLERRDRQEART